MKRPKVVLQVTSTSAQVIVHFKSTGKAARFASKIIRKPPKGVVKIVY